MKVSEIMRSPAVVIHKSDSLGQAARMMLQNNLRGLPVIEDSGLVCGFISVSDFLAKNKYFPFSRYKAPQLFDNWIPQEGIERIYKNSCSIAVGGIMSSPALTIGEDSSIEELVDLMMRDGLSRIPVVRDGMPVGIVARFDLLKLMVPELTGICSEKEPEVETEQNRGSRQ